METQTIDVTAAPTPQEAAIVISPEHSASAKRETFQKAKLKEPEPCKPACPSADPPQEEPQGKDTASKEVEKTAPDFTESDAEAGESKTDFTYHKNDVTGLMLQHV